jgi:hypothetical protein
VREHRNPHRSQDRVVDAKNNIYKNRICYLGYQTGGCAFSKFISDKSVQMNSRYVAGRFAQARGSSSWARAFNANLNQTSARRFSPLLQQQTRLISAMNLSQCLGEVPVSGFAEQYRSITQSFNSIGQSGSGSDSLDGEADAQVVAGATTEELEFVQIAEVPTLFTYCHDRNGGRMQL